MPELPEVETIRRSLEKNLVGKSVSFVRILEAKQFIGDPKKIEGEKIVRLDRRGKVLSIIFSNNFVLSIHLKLTGQILLANNKDQAIFRNTIPRADTTQMPGKTTRVTIEFIDASALYFNDLRKFGWMKLSQNIEEPQSVDVLSTDFTTALLYSKTKNSKKPIKVLLMDQEVIAGLGNIYANDSLWEAKISPLVRANELSEKEVTNLHMAIKKIIDEGIAHKGSSAKDEIYILPDSSPGKYQHYFKVYHQHGKPCKRCGTTIVRVKQAGRSTFYCPRCQATHTVLPQSVKDQPLF